MKFHAGITEMHIAAAKSLPWYCREMARLNIRPLIAVDAARMDTGPGSTLLAEGEETPEGVTAKTTLSFTLTDASVLDGGPHAFIVKKADGEHWLVGAHEAPFPKIKVKTDLSTPTEPRAGVFCTVEWAGAPVPVDVCPSF